MDKDRTICLATLYRSHLKTRGYQVDPEQLRIIAYLQTISDQLLAPVPRKTWASWLKPKNNHRRLESNRCRGLYLWGGVGRGKTYMLDFFYEVLPINKKLRLHYYQFMQEVHGSLKKMSKQKNPLKIIAKDLADRVRVLFLDEFFVSDITDAMILYRLLAALFEYRIVLITTSNFAPEDLYKNGLQRERFLPAIALIEHHTKVVAMQAGVDYRSLHIKNAGSYHAPYDEQSEALMKQCFTALGSKGTNSNRSAIEINDRDIKVLMHAPNVVWFEFKELCETPRSVSDYIMIAHLYHTVLISGVPVFNKRDDAARRFIQLVDEFYDQNVILVLSAAAQARELYQAGRLKFEFNRTVSRLLEMQSLKYWSNARKIATSC